MQDARSKTLALESPPNVRRAAGLEPAMTWCWSCELAACSRQSGRAAALRDAQMYGLPFHELLEITWNSKYTTYSMDLF